ncbi:hypothetical protein ACH5RR_010216 [Cinchona calisaya]|uniref:Uncharacterized protein n=1 Tax=Cinchona calisaya TaxID=153742 RepID=A0ABD3AGK9_9GENT
MAARFGTQLCFCLLLVFAVVCSARNTIFLSEEDTIFAQIEGRSLKIDLDDYGKATANNGHDPSKVSSVPRKAPKKP